MASFDEHLKKAKAAARPHKDVGILLDAGVSERIAELQAELSTLAADQRISDPRPGKIRDEITALQAEAAESLITLRFTRMTASDWADLTARSVQDVDVNVDRYYGYNLRDVARKAAPLSGEVVEDGTSQALDAEQWSDLWEVMSGHEFQRIVDAIFELNEYGPQERIDAAGKVSRAGSAKQ